MRTHTSPVQIRTMIAHPPPLRIVIPGKVHRNDAADATHSPIFHQVEGLCVGPDITFSDLKGHPRPRHARALRAPPSTPASSPPSSPSLRPSADVQISCIFCAGAGCRKCKHSGWIELLGCGMVDPAVFAAVASRAHPPRPRPHPLQPRNRKRLRLRHGSRTHRHDPPRRSRHRPLLLRRPTLPPPVPPNPATEVIPTEASQLHRDAEWRGSPNSAVALAVAYSKKGPMATMPGCPIHRSLTAMSGNVYPKSHRPLPAPPSPHARHPLKPASRPSTPSAA